MYSDNRDSEEKLLGSEAGSDVEDTEISTYRPKSDWRYQACLWAFQVLFFLLSLSILVSALLLQKRDRRDLKDHMPQWSPALEAVEGTGTYERFDGSFATPNKYKGPPSPEIDAAWDDIIYATGGVIQIDDSTLERVNASKEYSVKLPEEIGGGYMASVEVLHQLHCLNMLRQASHPEYYKDKENGHQADWWTDSPDIARWHLDHCIDNLRQKLMCDADAGILTYVWVKDHPKPFPDFNVQHKCRSFDSVHEWVEDRQLYSTEDHGVMRMPDTKELESPP